MHMHPFPFPAASPRSNAAEMHNLAPGATENGGTLGAPFGEVYANQRATQQAPHMINSYQYYPAPGNQNRAGNYNPPQVPGPFHNPMLPVHERYAMACQDNRNSEPLQFESNHTIMVPEKKSIPSMNPYNPGLATPSSSQLSAQAQVQAPSQQNHQATQTEAASSQSQPRMDLSKYPNQLHPPTPGKSTSTSEIGRHPQAFSVDDAKKNNKPWRLPPSDGCGPAKKRKVPVAVQDPGAGQPGRGSEVGIIVIDPEDGTDESGSPSPKIRPISPPPDPPASEAAEQAKEGHPSDTADCTTNPVCKRQPVSRESSIVVSQSTSNLARLRSDNERLKSRNSDARKEISRLVNALHLARVELSNVDNILSEVLTSESLPQQVYDILCEASEKISLVKQEF